MVVIKVLPSFANFLMVTTTSSAVLLSKPLVGSSTCSINNHKGIGVSTTHTSAGPHDEFLPP